MIKAALVGAILALAGAGLWLRPPPEWRFGDVKAAELGTGAHFETVFTYTSPEGTAHAPALLQNGELIWFDGIRESHNDVRILSGDFASGSVHAVFTRQSVSAAMTPPQKILTLGNAIAAENGIYITAVSLGGWAASSVILADESGDQSVRLKMRKLSLSPVLNRSHLVKSPIVPMMQGHHVLPTYFEMGRAYGVAALVDATGRVRGQSVMTGGSRAIQPMIVPKSETHAIALLRSFDSSLRNLMFSETQNGGLSWSAPVPLDIPNPSAPVAAVRLTDGRVLMLFNDDAETADTLSFAVSEDGRAWTRTRVLDGPGQGDLRYPMMAVLDNGLIAVTYSTGTKAGIVAHVLSADWALGE